MPSPTMGKGLLGNFLCGADPPATDQHDSPLPVLLPTSLSLRAILATRAGGGGAGRAGGHRILRDGRDGCRVEGGRGEIQGRMGNEACHGRGRSGDNRDDQNNRDGSEQEETNA